MGGADLAVSELQLFGNSISTFFEKSVESFRINGYKFRSSSLAYLTFFFSGFSGVWFFGLLVLLVLFWGCIMLVASPYYLSIGVMLEFTYAYAVL